MEPINSHLAVIDSTYAGNIFDYGQIVREKRYLGTNLDKYYKGIFITCIMTDINDSLSAACLI